MEEIKKLLEVIRNETVPLPGHPDPGALNDCWNEVFEKLEAVEHPRAADLLPCGHTEDHLVVNAVTSWCDACERIASR